MALRKKAMSKTKKVYIYGSSSAVVLFAFMQIYLTTYGITITDWNNNTINQDEIIKCGGNLQEPCIKDFRVCTTDWAVVKGKGLDIKTDTQEGVHIDVKKKDSLGRLRAYNLSKLSILNFTCADFRLNITKPINTTVKYSIIASGSELDPIFAGYTPDEFFVNITEQTSEIDRGFVEYEVTNPTSFNYKVNTLQLTAQYVKGRGGKDVSSRTIEFLTRVNVTVQTRFQLIEIYKYANGSSYHVDKGIQLSNETAETDQWVTDRTITPSQKVKVREALYWPAGATQRIDWQPVLSVSGSDFKQNKWAWFDTNYQNCKNVFINESNSKTWINLAVWFRGINLSGISHNGQEVVFVNQSCNGAGGVQWHMSFNGSLDGKNNRDEVNFTVLVNLTASQAFNGAIYYNNLTPVNTPSSRIIIVKDVFNESGITTATFYNNAFDSSSFGLTSNGEANLTALSSTTWISDTADHVRVMSRTNMSKGFSLSCEWRYFAYTTVLGNYGGCVAFGLSNPASTNHTGVVLYLDNVGGGEIIRGALAWASSGGTLINPASENVLHNSTTLFNNTHNINVNFSDSADGSAYSSPTATQGRPIPGMIAASAAVGDHTEIIVKWLCAAELNQSCIAEDQAQVKGIGAAIVLSGDSVNVTLLDPRNVTRINNTFFINTTSNASFDKIWYSINLTGGAFSANYTFLPNTTNTTGDGSYMFRVCVNSSAGNIACDFVNFSIASFNVTVTLPTNSTYTTNNITINSFSNKQAFNNGSWYQLDNNTNVTFNGNGTVVVADGSHNITVFYNMTALSFVNTTNANTTNSTVYFTVTRIAQNLTLKLNDLSSNRSYEDGTVSNVTVNVSNFGGTVCLDVNYPGLGTNTTCNAGYFVYNFTPYEYKRTIGDGSTSRTFGYKIDSGAGAESGIISAYLKFKNKQNYSYIGNYSAFQVFASNWTETNLNWSSQPCGGINVGFNITTNQCNSTGTGFYEYNGQSDLSLDIRQQLIEAYVTSRPNVSFLVQLVNKSGFVPQGNGFWSKDNGLASLQPTLVVTYSNGSVITYQTNRTEHYYDVTVMSKFGNDSFSNTLTVAYGTAGDYFKVYTMWNFSWINNTVNALATSYINNNQTNFTLTHHKYDKIISDYYINLTCIGISNIVISSNYSNYSKIPGFCYGGNATLNYISTLETSPILTFFGTNVNRFNLTVPAGKNVTNANITIFPIAGYNETISLSSANISLTDSTYTFCGLQTFYNITATRVNFSVCVYNETNVSSVGWANIKALEMHILNSTINVSLSGYGGGNESKRGGNGTGGGGLGGNESTTPPNTQEGSGGGGAASFGTAASPATWNNGPSGNTYGSFLLDTVSTSTLGSGAGAGGSTRSGSTTGSNGNPGGGAIRLRAQYINLTDTALISQGGLGGQGGDGGANYPTITTGGGGGGGASGGTIILSAQYLQLRNVQLNVTGGLGGCGGADGISFSTVLPACNNAAKNGTRGGYGRIMLFYNILQQNISVTFSGPNVYTVQGYPVNTTFDVFNDGIVDWNYTGTMTTPQSISVNTTTFKNYLLACSSDSYGVCTVPTRVFSIGQGQIQLQNINITYEPSPIVLNYTKLNTELNMSSATGFTNITFMANASGFGNFTLSIDRPGRFQGSAEYNLTVRYVGNDSTISTELTRYLKVQTSRFVRILPYLFTNDTVFNNIQTNSSKNVTPFGQSDSVPWWNLTVYAYDLPVQFCAALNASIPSINVTISNTTLKANGTILNASNFTVLNNTGLLGNYGLRLWADLNNTPVSSGIMTRLSRNLTVNSACIGCVGVCS